MGGKKSTPLPTARDSFLEKAGRKKKGESTCAQEALVLSERDREIFFDVLIRPPRPNARLKRAFRLARERIVS
jgi:uncharacterized protein (DUF1778 family)